MERNDIKKIIEKQRAFYNNGGSLSVGGRIEKLKRLKQLIVGRESHINAALKADLGKSATESYMCEVGMVLSELSYMIKRVKKFAKDKRVRTPLAQFAAVSFVKPSPYGVVLIMSPWNYPFLLTMEPLVDAIAAGNTAVIKPSAYSPNVSAVISEIVAECFEPEYAAVVTGGREENKYLLEEHFDYIFFTGSKEVGKEVMRKASEYLTPVTLELGGKSPCIVDSSAKIPLAAKRIVFGKFLNCGQTCVAPDYILCHESIKHSLTAEIIKQIKAQFSDKPLENESYGKIVNAKHFERLCGLIDNEKTVIGGEADKARLKIAPTVMDNVTFADRVMQEEIFGPILPIITFNDIGDAINTVNSFDSPLALYIFAQNKRLIKRVLTNCAFGGGCVNDTIIHLASSVLPFGGVGGSGMGSYHGKFGFDTFSHYKGIVNKKTFMDLPMRYQPYTSFKAKLIRKFLK